MQPTVQWPPFSISHMSTPQLFLLKRWKSDRKKKSQQKIASHIDGNDLKLCLNSYSLTIEILENISRNRRSTYEPILNWAWAELISDCSFKLVHLPNLLDLNQTFNVVRSSDFILIEIKQSCRLAKFCFPRPKSDNKAASNTY